LTTPARLARRARLLALVGGFAAVCVTGCGPMDPNAAAPMASHTAHPAGPASTPTAAPGPATAAPAAPVAAPGATQPPQAPAPAPPAAGPVRFEVVPAQSKATFRVREQLAGVPAPSDAVGATNAVAGQLTLHPESGIVGDASRVTVNLAQLRTDVPLRDNFIKQNTLQTARFPNAEFVPAQATGLPNPLPPSGEHRFTLTGPLTIRGVKKDVTWDVTARREGNTIAGTATTSFKFGDFGMTPPVVGRVLSIQDEIRLEVDLVANQAA
jgi:polyisoprenoid-binding protein YceI